MLALTLLCLGAAASSGMHALGANAHDLTFSTPSPVARATARDAAERTAAAAAAAVPQRTVEPGRSTGGVGGERAVQPPAAGLRVAAATARTVSSHLFERPELAEASFFVPISGAGAARLADPGATNRFVARTPPRPVDAAPRVVAAAAPKDAPPMPVPTAPVELAATAPAAAAPALPAMTASQALEAALVPRPTARPADRMAAARLAVRERAMPSPAVLAYARPDAGSIEDPMPERGIALPAPSAGNGTAIYDISAATVYLPNGERLEAHSGLGSLRDDPRFVHQRNRGATPPHTYDLRLRESLFHGVQAIRLTPVGGERRIYNRVGLLAHTYMLGPRGDSNGCVSFKDYKRFLAAFRRGEITRLVVVPRMSSSASRIASLFARR